MLIISFPLPRSQLNLLLLFSCYYYYYLSLPNPPEIEPVSSVTQLLRSSAAVLSPFYLIFKWRYGHQSCRRLYNPAEEEENARAFAVLWSTGVVYIGRIRFSCFLTPN